MKNRLHGAAPIGVVASVMIGGLVGAPASAHVIDLPVTIRDFSPLTHPDFENVVAVDRGFVGTVIGPGRKPVYVGPNFGTATTNGPAWFDMWFNDTPGVNLSMPSSLLFDNGLGQPGGVYTFTDDTFFPIDNMLLGNEGRPNNYHFTLELHTTFTYQPGMMFTFTGDDDLFVFINDLLVIDLGGVHEAETASVNLDTLGLTPGQAYAFDLFYAERHTVDARFSIQTSIVFMPSPGATTLAGLAGLLAAKRRREPRPEWC